MKARQKHGREKAEANTPSPGNLVKDNDAVLTDALLAGVSHEKFLKLMATFHELLQGLMPPSGHCIPGPGRSAQAVWQVFST